MQEHGPWYASNNPSNYFLNFQKNSVIFPNDNYKFKNLNQCDTLENMSDNSHYINNQNIHQGSQLAQTDKLKSLYYYNKSDEIYANDKKVINFINRKIKTQERFGTQPKIQNNSRLDIRHTFGKADRDQNYGSNIDLGKKYYGTSGTKKTYPKISDQDFGNY